MERKEIVKNVVEQIINMLNNNVIEENGSECFEEWCEDGDVFDIKDSYELGCHIKVMERLSPLVDSLSAAIDKELEV